jgi:ADP-L-glycero-D-manno-heptose 6-epimerase
MILITGGAGFIGANIVSALQHRQPVAVCDWFGTDDKWKNLRHSVIDRFVSPEGVEHFLAEHGKEISAIVHMGAISATTERDVDLIVRTNLQLSRTLWDFAAKRGIGFIYASSAATYGDGSNGFEDRSDEAYLAKLRPLNPYGWSKLAFDRQVLDLIARGEAAPPFWAGLKFFNVYGPREQHKGSMRSVMTTNFDNLRAGNPLKLFRSDRPEYEDGGQLRDFVYVGDCVSIVEWMLDNPFPSDLYNVGTGQACSWLEAGHAMFEALGQEPSIEFIDMPAHLVGRYQYYTQAPMDKLRAMGAPVPTTTLTHGVAATYNYLMMEAE